VGNEVRNRLVSPSAERNKGPIGEVLQRVLPEHAFVLEIASGTGQHVVHFAKMMPSITWQPSEIDRDCLDSISAWLASENLPNVRAPMSLDVEQSPWPIVPADAIVSINMVHIAPWSATEALMRGAERVLSSDGLLYLYGPYNRGGRHTSRSNQVFDAQLRAQNPEWGVRELEGVVVVAGRAGFDLFGTYEMPANNLSVVFRRRSVS